MSGGELETWLVSACLLGRACRYDGGSQEHAAVEAAVARHREGGGTVVAVCPEELGGLGTPRPAAELRGGCGQAVLEGRASVARLGDDGSVTDAFVRGAQAARALAPRASFAILKARSPSCGCGTTRIDGAKRSGDGVFAALLRKRGLQLCDEDNLAVPE